MGKNRKSNKKNPSKASEEASQEDDHRFAAAHNRPQFRVKAQDKKSKVVLDERFASVLTDPRFQLQEKDKYGRKKRSKKQQAKDELGEFYTVVDDDDDAKDNNLKQSTKDDNDDESSTASTSSSSSEKASAKKEKNDRENSDDEAGTDPASRISYLTALSRGELDVSSSSEDEDSDDQSSSDDDSSVESEDLIYGTAGVLDPSTKAEEDIEITYEDSPFLAVTNLDWTHVRAVDVFVLLSSFTPPGALKRVRVFPSDFGMEKMEHELTHGPPSLWKKKKKSKGEQDEDEPQQEPSSDNKRDGGDDSDSDNEEDNQSAEDSHSEDGSDDALPETDDDLMEKYAELIKAANEQPTDSDFDPEKLRAYEASKLKYFFAVAEFSSTEHADIAYKEVDGMEFEHSSSAADLRSIPKDQIDDVVRDRKVRDEATSVPSTYVPPDFVVSALQQTNVQCTWEAGDTERERALTKYTSAEQWAAAAEADDLKAYLASDQSSDEESDDEKEQKGAKLRKLLGLDSDDDDDEDDEKMGVAASHEEEASSEDDGGKEYAKEFTYVPGAKSLEDKIRTKLQSKEEPEQLTPWEKYTEKRKEKRREKRQRRKRSDSGDISEEEMGDNGDDFFVGGSSESRGQSGASNNREKMSKEEIELMLAGDNDEEVVRDYDMRGIQRIEKNRDKKLRGPRKRKEDKLKAGVSGQDFAIDLKDDRFAAVLEGDDGRFGIDRTDPHYKETAAMRDILEEQKQRRKKKRKKGSNDKAKVPPNVVEGSSTKSAGSAALSSLVKSLKTKVS